MTKLTEEQRLKICKEYEQGFSAIKLEKKYNINSSSIYDMMHHRGFKSRSRSKANRKYHINEHYFDKIDNQNKAYLLGLLFADGCNTNKNYTICIELKESDKKILEKFNEEINSNKPLEFRNLNSKNSMWSNTYKLYISNKHMYKVLTNHGIVPRKTFIKKFPDWIDDNLKPHFVRGYFDGNGHISKNYKEPVIDITSNENFLKDIKNYIKKNTELNSHFRKVGKKTYRVFFRGGNVVRRLIKFIYKDANLFIERKKERADIIANYRHKPNVHWVNIKRDDKGRFVN